MNRFIASMIAMASGWGVLNSLLLVVWMFESRGFVGYVTVFAIASAVVVSVAWLVIYMPVYVLLPRDSMMFEWQVAIPFGFATGFLTGLLCFGGSVWAGAMAGLVGGSAAGVGRFLLPGTEPYVSPRPKESRWDQVEPINSKT